MSETIADKTCDCGQPATTSYWKSWARHSVKVHACLPCAEKACRQITMEGKTLLAVCKELGDILKEEGLEEEGIHCWRNLMGEPEAKVPARWRWIACYPVTGGSEGHYVHIDFILDGYDRGGSNTIQHIATIKTFGGWAKAWEVANRCAWLLGA